MFCCCFPTFRGSGKKKTQNQCLFRCRRHWRNLRRLWPFGKSQPQSSNPTLEIVEELDDEFAYAISRYEERVCQDAHTIQCCTESFAQDIIEELVHESHYSVYRIKVQVHQASDTVQAGTECEDELALNLNEARGMRALQEGTLKKVVESMVPAVLGENISHISTFMFIHPAFSIAQQILDQLFTRSDAVKVFSTSGVMSPYIDQGDTPQDQVKKAIASMVGIWPEQVQNLGQLLFFPWFKLKQGFVQVNSPASQLMDHVLLPWVKLEHLEPPEAQLEVPRPELQNPPKPEEGPTLEPKPAPAMLVPEPASPLNESGCLHSEAQLMDTITQACSSSCSLTPH
ncbi:ral guanine nucleotide dissociation stimulator-like [Rousettus aegyptiacus]|uniref:ral guanine nucleotide dissociation stimulator-like n=1 Tax=Rousettus aegyptiacus TaxID=9407 RepID=UPI00168D8E22|nr:ral guanine nucleotide dissociation stimulator-like [Rousettus aegyptiacus]